MGLVNYSGAGSGTCAVSCHWTDLRDGSGWDQTSKTGDDQSSDGDHRTVFPVSVCNPEN